VKCKSRQLASVGVLDGAAHAVLYPRHPCRLHSLEEVERVDVDRAALLPFVGDLAGRPGRAGGCAYA